MHFLFIHFNFRYSSFSIFFLSIFYLRYFSSTFLLSTFFHPFIPISRGGPLGSSLTPTLFITYHSDMADFIPGAMAHFFADDLATVLAGRIGVKFTEQCIDLERRLQKFMDQLEFYWVLAVQPINYSKTQAMFSARAICYSNPMPKLNCGEKTIEWISSFKYLGYWLTTKLGWGNMIGKTRLKTRQRTALVNSFSYGGQLSIKLRRILFSNFVLPHFTWLFCLHPLFSNNQRAELSRLYFTLLKRTYRCQCWEDFTFSSIYGERPLDDICFAYWEKYNQALARSNDGVLLLEQSYLNAHRSNWVWGNDRIRCLHRLRRFVPHGDVLGRALAWTISQGISDSIPERNDDELLSFALFPETF